MICKECRSVNGKHRAGCPNARPPVAFYCDWCGAGIYEGEEYYDFNNGPYHKECFEENAVEIIIRNEVGLVLKTAESEGE